MKKMFGIILMLLLLGLFCGNAVGAMPTLHRRLTVQPERKHNI